MLKRIVAVILVLTVAVSLASCTYTEYYIPGSDSSNNLKDSPVKDFDYEIVEDYVKITKYKGDQTEVRIPRIIEGLYVCVIGEDAFESRASLKSVHIPDEVQVIEKGAFKRCYYMEKVTGGKGIVSIAEQAFIYNAKLKEFPWEEKLQIIGDSAFMWCESLERVDIVSSCDYIGNYAFRDCKKVAEINFADEVVSIGAEAFMATNITKLHYPYATNIIGDGAFKHNNSLVEITFDERVTELAPRAFQNSHALKDVVIPSHIRLIKEYAFGSYFEIETMTWENPYVEFEDHPLLQVTDYTVYGYAGSTAEFYVQTCPANRNIKFEAITE